MIKVDFPDPETPVMQVKTPKGMFTSISFRLLAVASRITKNLSPTGLLCSGRGMKLFPERYAPVKERSVPINSSGDPEKTTSPPFSPGPGPISMI
jgi:hypothetical protein